MMQQQSPCDDQFSTPANLRPIFNSAMFDDFAFISPPPPPSSSSRITPSNNYSSSSFSSCAAEEQQLFQRRSFVLCMDQQLRQQREEVEHQQAEHSDRVMRSLTAATTNTTTTAARRHLTLRVPDEDALNQQFTPRRIPLRPTFRSTCHTTLAAAAAAAQTCPACAKLSMETPPNNRPLHYQHCQQCSIMEDVASSLSSSSLFAQRTPLPRFTDNPGDDAIADNTELLDLSMDSDTMERNMLLDEPRRRILLRPKKSMMMQLTSRTSSPMFSIATSSSSSSSSVIDETDYFIADDHDHNNNCATASIAVVRTPLVPYPYPTTAPLLPLMSPEHARPRIQRPLPIRVVPLASSSYTAAVVAAMTD